jgi:hypothetical protein
LEPADVGIEQEVNVSYCPSFIQPHIKDEIVKEHQEAESSPWQRQQEEVDHPSARNEEFHGILHTEWILQNLSSFGDHINDTQVIDFFNDKIFS